MRLFWTVLVLEHAYFVITLIAIGDQGASIRVDQRRQEQIKGDKDADPDIPILKAAKAEYAKLQ